jgi:hypothetical protein
MMTIINNKNIVVFNGETWGDILMQIIIVAM